MIDQSLRCISLLLCASLDRKASKNKIDGFALDRTYPCVVHTSFAYHDLFASTPIILTIVDVFGN